MEKAAAQDIDIAALRERLALLDLPPVNEQVVGDVQLQQPAHAVVAEALPHLRKEQDHEPGRVLEALLERGQRYGTGRGLARGFRHRPAKLASPAQLLGEKLRNQISVKRQ